MISGLLEFFLGNTFPCVVFFGYGGHFLTLYVVLFSPFPVLRWLTTPNHSGSTFQPFYNAVAAYTPNGTQELTPAFGTYLALPLSTSTCTN